MKVIRGLLKPDGLVLVAEPLFSSLDGHQGLEKVRRFASNALLQRDRGRFIRDQSGYLKLWNGFSLRHGNKFRVGLHEFCGLILTA